MKAFKLIGLALFTILMCLSACSSGGDDPIEPTPKPEIPKSEITIDSSIISNGLSFSEAKGEQSISFTTNENWTLSVASTTSGAIWCTASATSGAKGSASVKFTVTENTSYDNRSVSVTIKSGTATKTFTVSQKCAETLLVSTNKYEIGKEGGTINVEIKSNINYKIEIPESSQKWITESNNRSLTNNKHIFEIAESKEPKKREGEIYIKSTNKSETIKIYQLGEAVILLSNNEIILNEQDTIISVDIKSNIDFGVQMPDVSWITEVVSGRGMSSHTLKYVIKANELYYTRDADIVFYDKNSNLKDTLHIIQTQKDAIILSAREYQFNANSQTICVELKSNVDFNYSILDNCNWIKEINNSRALVGHKLYFTISENESNEDRCAWIAINSLTSNLTDTISIKQYSTIPNDEVWYRTKHESVLEVYEYSSGFGVNILSNTYKDGKGVIKFDAPVTKIGGHIFNNGAESLIEFIMPKSVKVIEGGAFFGCSSLTNVIIPEGVTTIGMHAFGSCNNLPSINLPNSLVTIEKFAFTNCYSMKTLFIPAGVETIGEHILGHTPKFETFIVDNDNPYYSSLDGVLFNKDKTILLECPNGKKDFFIPESVTTIGISAFEGCNNLSTISLHEKITKIDNNAFAICRALSSISLPNSLLTIGEGAFMDCDMLTNIFIPLKVENIGNLIFESCDNLEAINVDSENCYYSSLDGILYNKDKTVIRICPNSKENVFLPNGVKIIGKYAFAHNYKLKNITISSEVETIDEYAFQYCSGLDSITIPGNVQKISNSAFQHCSKLTKIILSEGLTTIDDWAFSGCKKIEEITFPSSIQTLGSVLFCNCTQLVNIYCKAKNPPTIHHQTFDLLIEERVPTIYVPMESIYKYKTAKNWIYYEDYINAYDFSEK